MAVALGIRQTRKFPDVVDWQDFGTDVTKHGRKKNGPLAAAKTMAPVGLPKATQKDRRFLEGKISIFDGQCMERQKTKWNSDTGHEKKRLKSIGKHHTNPHELENPLENPSKRRRRHGLPNQPAG